MSRDNPATHTSFGDPIATSNLDTKFVNERNRADFGQVYGGDIDKRRAELYKYLIDYIKEIDKATTTIDKITKRDELLKPLYYSICDYYEQKYLKERFKETTGRDLVPILDDNPPPSPPAEAAAAAEAKVPKTSDGGSRKLKSKRKSSKSVRKFKKYNRRHIKSKKTRRVYK
jgi:hypothetical protein